MSGFCVWWLSVWMLGVSACLGLEMETADGSSGEDYANPEHYFIQNIFDKYGHEGVLTFEGFEHLMENLGLGNLRFDKKHSMLAHKTPDGRFKEVHDTLKLHTHNHTRITRSIQHARPEEEMKEECLSPGQLLERYGLEADHGVAISQVKFVDICPAIVQQLDDKVCAKPAPQPHGHSHNTVRSTVPNRPPDSAVWLYGSISILVISACGLLGVCLVPLLEKHLFQNLLSLLVALAVGTLCGDALLHLLPHAFASEESDHTLTVLKSSAAFFSLMVFFLLEAFIHGHSHSHRHGSDDDLKEKEYSMVLTDNSGDKVKCEDTVKEEKELAKSSLSLGRRMVVGRLVAIGDAMHNFTDGLAVGAAFRADLTSGIATALAVLTHELPHELGDFAVLLKSGMPMRRAIYYNVVSSIVSYIGMAAGVYVGHFSSASHWIYAITAGSFLYIALANLVPELHRYRKESGKNVTGTLLQMTGTFIGGAIMFLIAVYEDSLYELFDS